MQIEELLNTKQVAKILGKSDRTIEDWVYEARKGHVPDPIPFIKINRATRFDPKDFKAWMDRRKIRFDGTVEYGIPSR